MFTLALLDHLREEFKNEPDYKFRIERYDQYCDEIIIVSFRYYEICEIIIVDGCIIIGVYFGGVKRYQLSTPNCLEILNNEIKRGASILFNKKIL